MLIAVINLQASKQAEKRAKKQRRALIAAVTRSRDEGLTIRTGERNVQRQQEPANEVNSQPPNVAGSKGKKKARPN